MEYVPDLKNKYWVDSFDSENNKIKVSQHDHSVQNEMKQNMIFCR